ncbi:cupin domain-containing protein [Aquimarina hainanensis]|uniref:Cupin domain-containing protein n=1 Tax=Aquimarina hainanensis TaxID=1578017 RepID=A0ABW5N425_9FLAO|nr:cupin domain-containing protein [Aquimarina sp. TRL1]QKX05911.1 cupin domain-containing protein [Aquimarina sp. TRL1]
MNTAQSIIKHLDLQPHPEGGYFRETYRSKEEIPKAALPDTYSSSRNYTTAIYFLLTSDTFSAFHRIKQDEIWHFYDGAPIQLHMISPEGHYSMVRIGKDFSNGELPQFTVPGGYWFAANLQKEATFSLVGCTVSPGFDFQDFELPKRDYLQSLFPEHTQIITLLTR